MLPNPVRTQQTQKNGHITAHTQVENGGTHTKVATETKPSQELVTKITGQEEIRISKFPPIQTVVEQTGGNEDRKT